MTLYIRNNVEKIRKNSDQLTRIKNQNFEEKFCSLIDKIIHLLVRSLQNAYV